MAHETEEREDKDGRPPVTEFSRIPSQESARMGTGWLLAETLERVNPDFFKEFFLGMMHSVFRKKPEEEGLQAPTGPPMQMATAGPQMPPAMPPPQRPPVGPPGIRPPMAGGGPPAMMGRGGMSGGGPPLPPRRPPLGVPMGMG